MTKKTALLLLFVAILAKVILGVLYEIFTNETRKMFGLEPKDNRGGGYDRH
jgi:hypothetical protein